MYHLTFFRIYVSQIFSFSKFNFLLSRIFAVSISNRLLQKSTNQNIFTGFLKIIYVSHKYLYTFCFPDLTRVFLGVSFLFTEFYYNKSISKSLGQGGNALYFT